MEMSLLAHAVGELEFYYFQFQMCKAGHNI